MDFFGKVNLFCHFYNRYFPVGTGGHVVAGIDHLCLSGFIPLPCKAIGRSFGRKKFYLQPGKDL